MYHDIDEQGILSHSTFATQPTDITHCSFFAQLTDALGASDFLAPVCMLLVDKAANRVARQNVTDAQNSLFLPLSILERYPSELRLQVGVSHPFYFL